MRYENLPERCQECDKLGCIHIYMDGSADYTCKNPGCEYRKIFKETIEKYEKENSTLHFR